jgi:hypothetical protein
VARAAPVPTATLRTVPGAARVQDFSYGAIAACPRCAVLIEKTGGCDHMTCTRCGTHFSWLEARRHSARIVKQLRARGVQGRPNDILTKRDAKRAKQAARKARMERRLAASKGKKP